MKLLSIPSLKGIRASTLLLGIYFIMLPFDFYRVQSLGSITRMLAYLPIGFSLNKLQTFVGTNDYFAYFY